MITCFHAVGNIHEALWLPLPRYASTSTLPNITQSSSSQVDGSSRYCTVLHPSFAVALPPAAHETITRLRRQGCNIKQKQTCQVSACWFLQRLCIALRGSAVLHDMLPSQVGRFLVFFCQGGLVAAMREQQDAFTSAFTARTLDLQSSNLAATRGNVKTCLHEYISSLT